MRTGLGLLFGSSLVANVMLLLILAAEPGQSHITPNDTSAAVRSSTPALRSSASGDFGSKERALLRIERSALIDARDTADRYWQAGNYELEYSEAVRIARESIRDQLTDSFGSEIREDPLFRKYFRPMDPMFHFLTSDEQLAIERLKFERDKRLQAAMSSDLHRATSGNGVSPVSPQMVQRISRDFDEELARVLDANRLFEFRLRESATAQQLRSSRVEFTEPEFRNAYRLLARLAGNASGIEEVVGVREGLRDLLGSRRFALVWSTRDPVYLRVKDLLAKNGLTEQSADAVYQVINDFQDRKMRAALQAKPAPGAVPAASDSLEDQEREAIARIVGERLADEVIRSRALEAFRMFRSQSQPGQ